ncbi:hypothetical protein, variant [Capsaspora owczarzaki ATCC 30864]|nr:hypothetical protein, variant [Capsaspora owczarzaki ATCC 30864]
MPCGCSLRPKLRHQRLVDGVFPLDPSDGIVSLNMTKLTFFALQTPGKLPQVGKRLAKRLRRDLTKQRYGNVYVAIKAMDSLVQACHTHLHLFVESYLLMVENLLESSNADLQVAGTNSFVKFAYIKEEDTPSYHRRYDFFVSKFSQMCLSHVALAEDRTKIRLAGLRGLSALFVKTVDSNSGNIWADLDKIVPAILLNLRDEKAASHGRPISTFDTFTRTASISSPTPLVGSGTGALVAPTSTSSASPLDSSSLLEEANPAALAQSCLREMVSRANFANAKAILSPMLSFLDATDGWSPSWFAMECFRIVMFSIQSQFFYIPITDLLAHLDTAFSLQRQLLYLQNSVLQQRKALQEGQQSAAAVQESASSSAAAAAAAAAAAPTSPPSFTTVKVGMLHVLNAAIQFARGASGPSVLQSFNILLRQLRISVDVMSAMQETEMNDRTARRVEEQQYQLAVIHAIGVFADNLPDYQKMELMQVIADKLSNDASLLMDTAAAPLSMQQRDNALVQLHMLQAILRIAKPYACHMVADNTFPSTLFDPLLKLSVVPDPEMRLLVQQLLQLLICRPSSPSLVPASVLSTTVKSPIDTILSKDTLIVWRLTDSESNFLRKLHFAIYEHVILQSNTAMHFQALYTTHGLLLRLFGFYQMVDLVRVLFSLQDYAEQQTEWTPNHTAVMHAFIAALFKLSARLARNRGLYNYVSKILSNRIATGFLVSPVEFEDDAAANLAFLQSPTAETDAAELASSVAAANVEEDEEGEEEDEEDASEDDDNESGDDDDDDDNANNAAQKPEDQSDKAPTVSQTETDGSAPVSSEADAPAIDPRILEARRAAQAAAIEFLTVAQNMEPSDARKEILGADDATAAPTTQHESSGSGTKHAQFSEQVSVMNESKKDQGAKKEKNKKRASKKASASGKKKSGNPKFMFDADVTDDAVLFELSTVVALIKAEPVPDVNMADVAEMLHVPYKHERVIAVPSPRVRKSVIPKPAVPAIARPAAVEAPRPTTIDVSANSFKRILVSAPQQSLTSSKHVDSRSFQFVSFGQFVSSIADTAIHQHMILSKLLEVTSEV